MGTSCETRIIVGLGNPGPRYAVHRHNVGFGVLDLLARRRQLAFTDVVDGAWTAATEPASGLVLLKPLAYMNLSGEGLLDWSRRAGVTVTGGEPAPVEEGVAAAVRPLVVCDDLTLPLGSLRLRARGSSGGQNGLASLIERLGGEVFPRLRLGVAPLAGEVAPEDWPDHVLAAFEPDEQEAATAMIVRAADAVEHWLSHGLEATVARFNRRVRPSADED